MVVSSEVSGIGFRAPKIDSDLFERLPIFVEKFRQIRKRRGTGSRMGNTERCARRVAETLVEDGECFVTESDAIARVKEEGNMTAPWERHVRAAFDRNGWTIDGDAYYHVETLRERTVAVSDEFRRRGDPVISRGLVSRTVTGAAGPTGEWAATIDDAMAAEGWNADEECGLYYLSPDELVTKGSLAYYLADAFGVPSGD